MKAAIRTVYLASVLIAIAAIAPTPAAADEAASAKREADRHFKTGVRLFDEGKYSEALAEFEQAYTLESHPLVLYNLAAAHRALSQYAQAVELYNRFIAEGRGVVRRRQLARGRRELAELLHLIARIDVTTRPEGALVSLDGRAIGRSPLGQPLILGPGDHVVSATLDGHLPAERAVRVAAGDSVAVALSLVEEPPPEPIAAPAAADLEPEAISMVAPAAPSRRRLTVSASFATNAIEADSTGVPVLGLAFALGDRVSLGIEAVLVAYSAVPEVRLRLLGDALSLHAIAAVPISFTDGDERETFAAAAGGLGVRLRAHDRFSLRAEAWVSYAGSERGTTVPALAGAELWF